MVCLSIVCLPAEDKFCGWDKAHADWLMSIGQNCVRLFLWGWLAGSCVLQCKETQSHTWLCRRGRHAYPVMEYGSSWIILEQRNFKP